MYMCLVKQPSVTEFCQQKNKYAARKKSLDIQLEQYSEDVEALSQELEQSTRLEEHMESITKFAKTATAELVEDDD